MVEEAGEALIPALLVQVEQVVAAMERQAVAVGQPEQPTQAVAVVLLALTDKSVELAALALLLLSMRLAK
jgi:hypothetical protein